jgi:hypothetical protein
MDSYMKNLILFISVVALLAACSDRSDSKVQEMDPVSPMVAAKVTGQRYERGQSSITFGENGTFEILMDADVRAFPASGLVKEGEVDARCQFKLAGTVQFKSPNGILAPEVGAKSAGLLTFKSARVLSARVYRTDLNSVEPRVVCTSTAERILKTERASLAVLDVSDDRLELAGLMFNIYSEQMNAFAIDESMQRAAGGDNRKNNFYNSVFVKSGSKSDQTSSLLPILAGVYDYDSFPRLTMDVSLMDRQIYLVSEKCALQARYSIEGLVYTRDGLYLRTKTLEASKVSSDRDCSTLFQMLELIAKGDTLMSFETSKEKKTMTFIQPYSGYSQGYRFKL